MKVFGRRSDRTQRTKRTTGRTYWTNGKYFADFLESIETGDDQTWFNLRLDLRKSGKPHKEGFLALRLDVYAP